LPRLTFEHRGLDEQVTGTSGVAPWQFDQYVHAEAEGYATPEQAALLEANAAEWQTTLLRLRRETREHLQTARKLPGDERDLVVADLEEELERLDDAWEREFGEPEPEPVAAPEPKAPAVPKALGRVQLQLSWEPGSVVAWAGGHGIRPGNEARVRELLSATGAPESNWRQHAAIPLTGNARAEAVAIPVGEILGWLVAAGAGELGDDLAPSARWLGGVAIWAVELTARGAMVPLLRRRTRRSGRAEDAVGSYSVRWTPPLVAPDRLTRTAQTMPGSVRAADRKIERAALTRSVLTGVVDAI
jgi:hypothetical protein